MELQLSSCGGEGWLYFNNQGTSEGNSAVFANLSVAPLHVSKRHLRVDGMAAGDAEDLKVCVVTVSFRRLDRDRPTASETGSQRGANGQHAFSYLLVVLDLLLLGHSNDAFQLVKTLLHQREAEPGCLLLFPDAFQLPPPHFLGNAGTLLPLLDPLREDLIDATVGHTKHRDLTLLTVVSVETLSNCCRGCCGILLLFIVFIFKPNGGPQSRSGLTNGSVRTNP